IEVLDGVAEAVELFLLLLFWFPLLASRSDKLQSDNEKARLAIATIVFMGKSLPKMLEQEASMSNRTRESMIS
ncbi:MAG TPA: hypothetical protein VF766_11875, partial [Pyrinomonadaceae bacterium]